MSDSATPWTAAHQAPCPPPTPGAYSNLSKSVMPSNHIILCHPLLFPPSIFPSMRFFSNESVLRIRWPKDWSFSSSISPSNEYSGLITFSIDRLNLLAVQGTHKSLLQHHTLKASILRRSAFFTVQLTSIHDYWKNHSFDYILCSQSCGTSIQSAKTRLGADCGSDHELLIAKFRLKLKKVGKTTRPFRYALNQIPYNYTVEVRNRFKRLDLIDKVLEE